MQSAWSSKGSRSLAGIRSRLPLAELPTFLLVLALAAVIAQSTVVMQWVDHDSQRFVNATLLAVLAISILAVIRPLPAAVALPVGLVAAAVVPWFQNASSLQAAHPGEPFGLPP